MNIWTEYITLINTFLQNFRSPKPHILSMITTNVTISSETNMGPPIFTSVPLSIINENSQMTIPTSEDNRLVNKNSSLN